MNALHETGRSEEEPLLPLVRLGLILPFVEELDGLEIDADAVLVRNGLVRETVCDPNVFVPSIVIHRFLEDAARTAGQPYFGVMVGERLDLPSWPPFVDAVSRATTLAEFLIRFIRSAKDEATSARHSLEVGAVHTLFRERRTSKQAIAPAHNDAFTLGVLRRGAGSRWNPEQVQLTVCDPENHLANIERSGVVTVTKREACRAPAAHFPTVLDSLPRSVPGRRLLRLDGCR
jgi:hypothetical protein